MAQGSILGPLLFLIYINDFYVAVKYSECYHFADDTTLLNFNSYVNSINKQVNYDLKILSNWLKVSKISLHIDKTEVLLFFPLRNNLTVILKSN